jgi:predicted AAA+ superfamily ATPase
MEQVLADRLEKLFRQYLRVGGMTRVVKAFADKVLMEELQ